MWTVYEHRNKINGKRYFGITSQEPKKRWKCGHGYKKNKHFYAAIQKYGWDNFEHIIILQNVSEEEASYTEKYLIKWYNTTKCENGYNMSTGGEGGATGIVSPLKGKHLSEEHRKNISKGNKGRIVTEETRKKISKGNKGKIRSEETKKRISETQKGRKQSEESNQKRRKTLKGRDNNQSKKVMRISTGEIWNSGKEASYSLGKGINYVSTRIYRGDTDWKYI